MRRRAGRPGREAVAAPALIGGRGAAAGIAAAFLAFAGFAVAAPLAAYTVSLAAFGGPHVLSELRYVDRRFGRRLGGALFVRLGVLLALVVTARALLVAKVVPASIEAPMELGLVAALALSVAWGTASQASAAVAVALIIGAATWLAPYDTLVVFALLHNLTPLGFLWQLTPRGRRAAVMAVAVLGLIALPLLVATGLPRALLGGAFDGPDPLGAGPLGAHLFAYVPPFLAGAHDQDLFTAAVVAQGGHYLAVIVALPAMLRRIEPDARGLAPWPSGWPFAALLAGAGAAGLAGFSIDFARARGLYGIAASLHAWIEIPLLILALTGQSASASPTAQETALAPSETSIA